MTDPTNAHTVVADRIRAQLERERRAPTKVTQFGQVPSSVDSLTSEWWTAVMCAGVPEARVSAHSIVDGSSGTHARHRHALARRRRRAWRGETGNGRLTRDAAGRSCTLRKTTARKAASCVHLAECRRSKCCWSSPLLLRQCSLDNINR